MKLWLLSRAGEYVDQELLLLMLRYYKINVILKLRFKVEVCRNIRHTLNQLLMVNKDRFVFRVILIILLILFIIIIIFSVEVWFFYYFWFSHCDHIRSIPNISWSLLVKLSWCGGTSALIHHAWLTLHFWYIPVTEMP